MNLDPYKPPIAQTNPPPLPGSSSGKVLAVTGALLQLGPVVGVFITLVSMWQAFISLGSSGMGDPAGLSAAIGGALFGIVLGMLLGLVGFVLLFIALLGSRYRAPWFFWFLTIYGGFLTLSFPFGTAFGLFFLIYCIVCRDQFQRPRQIIS